jgi:pyruvate dehydrogenase E2 component (dihydrolipoamide acetyltransferase)
MEIKLPNLGEGAESGVVINIPVKPGDKISKGQIILELENEKAVAPIPSPVDGVVTKIHVHEGDKISVGQSILSVETSSTVSVEAASTPNRESGTGTVVQSKTEARPKAPIAAVDTSGDKSISESSSSEVQEYEPIDAASGKSSKLAPPTSPSIRKLARELGIDLSRVRGSEYGGRIVMKDLRDYIQWLQKTAFSKQPQEKPAVESVDFSKWGLVSKQPMTPLRQTISRKMLENWSTIPHVTQFDEADITELLELIKKHTKSFQDHGARLTLTVCLLKPVVAALQKHPIFNSSLDESANAIVYKKYWNIGIAVDTEAGLLVPVLREVDKKSCLQLAIELSDLAARARSRKILPEELKGGTFTISNQGGIGGSFFTPIINKPEVAILGVGRSSYRPVMKNEQIVSRAILPLSLSYDHRLIDGGNAARFITDLVREIENFSESNLIV